jgi:hypothetical protein
MADRPYFSLKSCLKDGVIRAGYGSQTRSGAGAFFTPYKKNGKPGRMDYQRWDLVAETAEAALQLAEEKRQAKIDALSQQLVKLRRLSFTVEDFRPTPGEDT